GRRRSPTVDHYVLRMHRLPVITYRLPYSTASTAFLAALRTLLAGVPYAAAAPGRLVLTPSAPVAALPVTAFEIANIPAPEVRFGDGWSLTVDSGEHLRGGEPTDVSAPAPTSGWGTGSVDWQADQARLTTRSNVTTRGDAITPGEATG